MANRRFHSADERFQQEARQSSFGGRLVRRPLQSVSGPRKPADHASRTAWELARADIGYRELAERLEKHGLKETEASIANKISRGTFSATFLLATLKALEVHIVRLETV